MKSIDMQLERTGPAGLPSMQVKILSNRLCKCMESFLAAF